MTTLLSSLVSKIPGLALANAGLDLTLTKTTPRLIVASSDNAANGDYPYLLLKTAYQNSGSGGALKVQALNASAAYVDAAVVRGKLTTLTAGAEVSEIDLTVLVAGTQKSVNLLGAGSLSPSATNAFTLGLDANRWGGLYVGDGTVKGDALIASSQFQVGTSSNHALALKTNSTVQLTIDTGGSLTMAATSARIKADFSNATDSSRVMFSDKTASKSCYVGAVPSAGGAGAGFIAYGNPDASNSDTVSLTSDGSTAALLQSGSTGTGTARKLQLKVGSNSVAIELETNGDVTVGKSGIATGGTSGFLYVPAVAGTMTGVPTSRANFVPVMYDSTNNKIMVYNGGGWKQTAALT